MIKDWVAAGALIGLLADLVKLGLNYLAFRLGFAGAIFWGWRLPTLSDPATLPPH
ncbi:MAG: hypothetical protein ACM3X6_15020 [Patescibacteria group bacterium]